MKRSSGLRETAKLSESVHRQLDMYAIAATAAGVGLVAFAPSAEAKIVYTPAHITLPKSTPYPLDLNHDGVNDISFNWSSSADARGVWVSAFQGNAVVGYTDGLRFAAALKREIHVGPRKKFVDGKLIFLWEATNSGGYTQSGGQWKYAHKHYLGVKFSINGNTHYGWVRINLSFCCNTFETVITGYAYETVPDRPIITERIKGPDDSGRNVSVNPATRGTPALHPGALGMLAIGSPGLSIWRRKESVVGGWSSLGF